MASKLLGRCACPLCADDKAHVKLKTDKAEGQTAYPYIHCRECGLQVHTKNRHQAELLLGKTRPENIPTPTPEPTPEPAPTPVPAPAPARAGRFSLGGLL